MSCIAASLFLALAAGAAQPRYGGEIRLPLADPEPSFDPLRCESYDGRTLQHAVYETLVTHEDGTPHPALAESWRSESGGKRWVFVLRPAVYFHDYRRLAAFDVVRSLERAAASSNVYPWIPRIASVSAPDERTVLVALDEPVSNYPLFLSLPRYAILPGGDPSARIGTGPFRVESVEHGEIALSAFPGHRDGRPFVDRVEFLHADNPRTRILEFMMGRYAATLLPVKDLPRFLEQEEWRNQIVTVEHGNIDYIGIRCDRPPFDRPSVRKAANQALDREGLRTLLGEEAVLQAGVDPFAECDPLEIYPFNRQKARKAIAGEGAYTNVVVMGVEESPYADAVVLEKIVADLRGAGLARLVVERAPGAAFRDAMAEGRYDLFYTTLFVDIPIAERYRRPFDGGWNPCGYAAGKANLLETPPWIFLFRRRLRLIHHPYVQGLSLHADGCIDFQGAWRE